MLEGWRVTLDNLFIHASLSIDTLCINSETAFISCLVTIHCNRLHWYFTRLSSKSFPFVCIYFKFYNFFHFIIIYRWCLVISCKWCLIYLSFHIIFININFSLITSLQVSFILYYFLLRRYTIKISITKSTYIDTWIKDWLTISAKMLIGWIRNVYGRHLLQNLYHLFLENSIAETNGF